MALFCSFHDEFNYLLKRSRLDEFTLSNDSNGLAIDSRFAGHFPDFYLDDPLSGLLVSTQCDSSTGRPAWSIRWAKRSTRPKAGSAMAPEAAIAAGEGMRLSQ
jgi:hypothetical protein